MDSCCSPFVRLFPYSLSLCCNISLSEIIAEIYSGRATGQGHACAQCRGLRSRDVAEEQLHLSYPIGACCAPPYVLSVHNDSRGEVISWSRGI